MNIIVGCTVTSKCWCAANLSYFFVIFKQQVQHRGIPNSYLTTVKLFKMRVCQKNNEIFTRKNFGLPARNFVCFLKLQQPVLLFKICSCHGFTNNR